MGVRARGGHNEERSQGILLQTPYRNELENKQVQYQEEGTEVDARTAELYSKQGNIDITEFVVIDETKQCEKCREHNAKGKSFCTGGIILQELSAEKTKR